MTVYSFLWGTSLGKLGAGGQSSRIAIFEAEVHSCSPLEGGPSLLTEVSFSTAEHSPDL